MKTYDFSSNSVIQAAMRQYANQGTIDDIHKFMIELDGLLAKIEYYKKMELKYADLLEDSYEMKKGIIQACQKLEKLGTVNEMNNAP